jgi:23S rRNA pseudouridine2605 synthase
MTISQSPRDFFRLFSVIESQKIRKLKEFSKKKIILKKKEQQVEEPAGDGLIRLNKYISNSGVCSRREADKIISDGLITINGEVVTELGYKVSLDDDVRFDGRRLNPERKVYLLLNKPRGFVTTLDDPHAERTVMQLVQNACTERIYPVGRLDMQTTGVLLFTNDGELAKKLTHPSYEKKKVYHVQLDQDFLPEDLEKIRIGIELEDGFIAADDIQMIDPEHANQVGIEIHSGKNRIVRRIFNHLGYNVEKLDRVMFAGLTKKDLPRGRHRFLTPQEINFLKMS